MIVYTVGIFFSFLFMAIAVNLSRNERYYFVTHGGHAKFLTRAFTILSCAVPICIAAVRREDIGTDLRTYRQFFVSRSSRFSEDGEYLYSLLMDAVHIVSDDPQIFVATTCLITYGLYYFAIHKSSENPPYSVLLFFLTAEYFGSMNLIRQYMAAAVLLLALPALEKREWVKAIPFIVAAFLVHKSSATFLIIVLLRQFQFSPLILMAGLGITALFASVVKTVFFYFIQKYTISYAGYFLITSGYSESDFTFASLLAYISFFAVLCYLYYIQKEEFSGKMWVLLNGTAVGLFLCVLSAVLPRNASRLQLYADILIVIYAPSMLRAVRPKTLQALVRGVVIAGYLAICVYSIVLLGRHEVLPYKTFWQ